VSAALATRVKQIAAGVLDVGYADGGLADGPAVVLLHGWPYDIHTFDEVSPLLAAAGHRVRRARLGAAAAVSRTVAATAG
jgi:pimeloyl-ACP methyl ester carboxylesterase